MKRPIGYVFIILMACAPLFFGCPAGDSSVSQEVRDSIIQARRDSIRQSVRSKEIEKMQWEVKNFVDDFGDPTGNRYLSAESKGTFSNSATNDSPLFAQLLVTTGHSGLFLYEYRRSSPAVGFIGNGIIRLRNQAGKTITLFSFDSWSSNTGLLIDKSNSKQLVDFLSMAEGEIQVVVRDEYSSVYRFSLNATGFSENYLQLAN